MTFRLTARIAAAVCAVLFVLLFVVPTAYAPVYGVTAGDGVVFMTRRASPLFLGFALVLWAAASAPRSALRDAIALAMAVTFVGVAFTGLSAWIAGTASWTILGAAIGECAIAAVLWFTRKN